MASKIPSWDDTKPTVSPTPPSWDETTDASSAPSWEETAVAAPEKPSLLRRGWDFLTKKQPPSVDDLAYQPPVDPMTARIEDARTRDTPISKTVTPDDVNLESVGSKFRATAAARKEERRKAIGENTKFTNLSTPKPVPARIITPGEYAAQETGVSRDESNAGKAFTSLGDAAEALVNVTSVPLVTLLRAKTYNARMGEKVLEAEAGLQGQKAVRDAKARQAKGQATEEDQKALEADKFLSKLHGAYQAVKQNPTEAAGNLLLGVLEDAPIYILTAPIGGEAVKLAEGIAKEGAAAARLAKITERLGDGTPAAARAVRMGETAAAKAATEEALVKAPATVSGFAKNTAEDMIGNVTAGAATSQARGQKYDAAQLAQDLVASAAIAAGGSLTKALRDNRPLTPEEFHDLQKAVDVAGIHEHPQILELLPGLKAAAGDEKFVNEGGRIRLEKAGKPLTHEEALASGYGPEFLNKIGITPEAPGEVMGSTKGREITLHGGADQSTLSEEMTHVRQNVLADKAAADPAGAEAAVLGDVKKWADETRAAHDGPLPESDVELFGQAYEGSLEGVTVSEELRKRFEQSAIDVYRDEAGVLRRHDNNEVVGREDLKGWLRNPEEEAKTTAAKAPKPTIKIETPEFKKWFGESKVVDEDGKPLVVYHGTDKDFDAFKEDGINWMSASREDAEDYSPNRVVEGFVSIKNPADLDDISVQKLLKKNGIDAEDLTDVSARGEDVKRILSAEGYDGITTTHYGMGDGVQHYAPFSPTQIKSATGNTGAFNPEDPRINYQLRARKGTPERAEADRHAALKTLQIMLETPGAGANKAAEKAGLKGAEAEAATKRAKAIYRDMNKSGSYDDAVARDALRDHMKPAVETLKQTILRTTGEGITGNEIITAKSALKDVIRRLQLEAKVDEAKATGKARLDSYKQAVKDAEAIRDALSESTRDLLPPEMRGKMVTAVADAKTPRDLEKGLQKIQDLLDDHEHSEAVSGLQELLKGTNPRLLRPEFRDKFLAVTENIDPRGLSDREETRLWKLADWHEKNKGTDDPDLEAIPASEIEKLKRLDQTRIADMNVDEIREIQNTVQQILHQNELKNTLIGARDTRVYEQTVNDATEQIVKANPDEAKNTDGVTGYLKSAFGMESLSPEVVARIVGGDNGVIHDITYKQPVSAKSLAYRMENGYRGALKAFFESQDMTGPKLIDWRNEKVKIPLESGEEVELTRPQLVSLYATVQNVENMDAVLKNGLILESDKGIIGKEFKVSRQDIKNIIAGMDEFDVKTAEMMLSIFESLKQHLNKASVKLEGYEKYTRDRYFPRTADRGFMNRNLTNLASFWKGGALENLGIGKDVKQHKLPFVLMDATQVFDRHLHDAASYSEMAVPIRNALRVVGNAEVGSAIRKHVGKNADKNIEDFLTDVSGMKGFDLTDAENTVNSLARQFAVGTLGLRPTTIVNNLVGAPLQIMAEINAKQSAAFLKNMANFNPRRLRELFDEMMVLDGYFEHRYGQDPYKVAVYGGRSHVETIGNSKAKAKFKRLQDLAMKPIQDAEKLAGINLYKTLKETTSRADAIAGMEGFYGKNGFDPNDPDLIKKYAASETMMIVRRTQNAVDDFDKSKFARSLTKSPMASTLFMFQSQIFKLRDMSVMAYMDLKRAGGIHAPTEAKAKFAKRMGLIVASAALVPTAASLLMRRFRDGFRDEDERDKAKRWGPIATAAFNLADVIHPAVGGATRTVAAGLSGKGFSGGRGGFITESLDGVAKGAHALFEHDWEKAYKNLLPAIAITGVPASGPLPVIEGFFKMVTDGDPVLPLLNARYEVKKKFGVDAEGKEATANEALRLNRITIEEYGRWKALDHRIQAINRVNKSKALSDGKKKALIAQVVKGAVLTQPPKK